MISITGTTKSIRMPKTLLVNGIWNSELRQVTLTSVRGKFISQRSSRNLSLQEAIFLIHRGELVLVHSEIVLSMQESLHKLFSDNLQLEQFIVLSHIFKFGFISCDHPVEEMEDKSIYEKKRKLEVTHLSNHRYTDKDWANKMTCRSSDLSANNSIYCIYKRKPFSRSESREQMNVLYIPHNQSISIPKIMLQIASQNEDHMPILLASDGKMATKFFLFEAASHFPNPLSMKKCSKLSNKISVEFSQSL